MPSSIFYRTNNVTAMPQLIIHYLRTIYRICSNASHFLDTGGTAVSKQNKVPSSLAL